MGGVADLSELHIDQIQSDLEIFDAEPIQISHYLGNAHVTLLTSPSPRPLRALPANNAAHSGRLSARAAHYLQIVFQGPKENSCFLSTKTS